MPFPVIVNEVSTQQIALAPEISTWPDENRSYRQPLRRLRRHHVSRPAALPACSAGEMSELLLPRRGTLVAWTTQDFPPGAPYTGPTGKDFVPFGVGLVQLGDVMVEARLTETDPEQARSSAWRSSWRWCRSAPTTTATRS